MFLSIGYAFFEQTRDQPSRVVTALAIGVFMVCLMLFSSRIPSKNKEEDDEAR